MTSFSDFNDDLLKVSPDGELLWTFSSPIIGSYKTVVTESGVYVYRSRAIYKVDLSTGELIWESNLSYSTNNFEVSAGDVYALNRTTRILTKLNGENGTVAWTYQTPSGYHLDAVVGDGVYMRNGNQIRKVGIETGMEAWTTTLSGFSFFNPVVDSSAFYIFTTTHNRLYKLNASDGTLAWTFNDAPVRSIPVLASDGVYLAGQQSPNPLIKVNLSDGREVWRVNGIGVDWLYPNGIYVPVLNQNTLRKINIADGTEDWSVTVNGIRGARGRQRLIEDGSDIYALATFSSVINDLVKLNVSDGSEQWRYEGPESNSVFQALAIPDFSLGG